MTGSYMVDRGIRVAPCIRPPVREHPVSDDKYTDRGHRGDDPRHGFGDDMGTRVGRPDGAHEAPHDASGAQRKGQPGTNSDAVPDGIEGSIMSDDREGGEQRRVREASGDASGEASGNVNPDKETGDDRRVFDL
jgi:hypothetical protein